MNKLQLNENICKKCNGIGVLHMNHCNDCEGTGKDLFMQQVEDNAKEEKEEIKSYWLVTFSGIIRNRTITITTTFDCNEKFPNSKDLQDFFTNEVKKEIEFTKGEFNILLLKELTEEQYNIYNR